MSSNTPRADQVERNLFINGNMDFWQRGTSFSSSSVSTTRTADRLQVGGWPGSNTSNQTTSRSTDVPTQAQSGFASVYSHLVTTTNSAATSGATVFTRIEGQDYQQIHGRKVRFQFWVKSSVAGTYSIYFQNSGSTRSYVTTYSVASANVWQKVAIDLQLDTAGTWNFDNTLGLEIGFPLGTGSNANTSTLNQWQAGTFVRLTTQTDLPATTGATFQLAQVMLIPQDFTQAGATTVDVPFQRCGRSIGHELQLCQRYFEKSYNLADAPGTATAAGEGKMVLPSPPSASSGVFFETAVYYRVQKRASPTITSYNPNSGSSSVIGFCNSAANYNSTQNSTGIEAVGDGGFNIYTGSVSTANYGFIFQWTADAEL